MDIFVARQPIFNRNQDVMAYELLYRENEQNFFSGNVASNVATSILLMNTYLNFGIQNLVADHRAFVNFDKELIMNDIPQLLNKDSVVVEILETVKATPELITKIKKLKALGYTIAVDDVVLDYEYNEFLELADIIKVEFMGETRENIEKLTKLWLPKGKKMLAEKVETREEYEWAKKMGFHYFQGYFFSKPSMVKSKSIKESSVDYMRVLAELNEAEPDYKKVADMVTLNVSMTYKVLKLVNSHFMKSNQINSIHHAISMLGVNALRKWISLALVQTMSTKETSELVTTSMVRSHLLETLASHSNLSRFKEELSLIGVLSILDVIFEKPMCELVDELPLTDMAKKTLMGEETLYTAAYNLCIDYEKGRFDRMEDYGHIIAYDLSNLSKHYVDAVKWADDIISIE